jgi:hypothetical protein
VATAAEKVECGGGGAGAAEQKTALKCYMIFKTRATDGCRTIDVALEREQEEAVEDGRGRNGLPGAGQTRASSRLSFRRNPVLIRYDI